MDLKSQVGFHEATVREFDREGGRVRLLLEDVLVDKKKSVIELVLTGLSPENAGTQSGGEKVSLMGAPDGEILSLNASESSISLLVEWNDFTSGTAVTEEYEFQGEGLSMREI